MSTETMAYPLYQAIEAKTAAYTILHNDLAKLFTNRGAGGSVTFTLPSVTGLPTGWWCEFFSAVLAQNFVIASEGSSDNITTFNDLTADSLTLSTSAERAGYGFRLVWDGTGWLAFIMGQETATLTVG